MIYQAFFLQNVHPGEKNDEMKKYNGGKTFLHKAGIFDGLKSHMISSWL